VKVEYLSFAVLGVFIQANAVVPIFRSYFRDRTPIEDFIIWFALGVAFPQFGIILVCIYDSPEFRLAAFILCIFVNAFSLGVWRHFKHKYQP